MTGPRPPRPDGFGITRLADLTALDTLGLPVWSAVRPAAWSFSQSQGKGLTAAEARCSALMEARETALAEGAARLAVAVGTAEDLARAGHALIDLDQCHACTDPGLARRSAYPWLRGRGLIGGAPVLVPLPLVSLDFRAGSAAAMRPFRLSSSGLAARGDRALALRHALLEAVETDALCLAQAWPGILERAPAPRLGADPGRDRVLARLAAAGVTATLRDITSDTGLPTVLCWLTDAAGPGGGPRRAHPFAGSACRLTLESAALAALLEAAQSRLTDISGAREDIRPDDYARGLAPPPRPNGAGPTVATLARPARPRGAVRDLGLILGRLTALGLPEPVAVDLTAGDEGLACVAVLCPGLETGLAASGHRAGPRAAARRLRHAMGLA